MKTKTRKALETLAIGKFYELPESDPTWTAIHGLRPKQYKTLLDEIQPYANVALSPK